MYKPVGVVEVWIWGKRVGAVALDPKLGYYVFEYDPQFVRTGIELAPLTMPLSQRSFLFSDLPEHTYQRLPALLADALPDDFGNALIEAWMSRNGIVKSQITPLDRLAYMGKRGVGALEFKPARSSGAISNTAVSLSALVESARQVVAGNIDSDAKAALAQIIQVGTSAGGARAKAVISWNPTSNEIRPGQFDVESGFEHWLLKFDGMGQVNQLIDSKAYGRVEYAYSQMAITAGIAMSPCRLLEENGRAHFMTRRFDREGHQKHHLQTLCAMAHLDFRQLASHDYAQFFQTINRLQLGYDALEEGFRRMVFNVMAANCDDHTKNSSFILKEGEDWQLAPAYDLVYAYNPDGKWTYQQSMSVNGKFFDITSDDFLIIADRFGIGSAPEVLKQVGEAVSAWPDFAKKAGLSVHEMERIMSYHRVLTL